MNAGRVVMESDIATVTAHDSLEDEYRKCGGGEQHDHYSEIEEERSA